MPARNWQPPKCLLLKVNIRRPPFHASVIARPSREDRQERRPTVRASLLSSARRLPVHGGEQLIVEALVGGEDGAFGFHSGEGAVDATLSAA